MTEETIQKCLRKAGIFTSNMDVVNTSLEEDNDPFSECDLQEELECLIDEPCLLRKDLLSLKEYLEGENELQVCVDTGGDD